MLSGVRNLIAAIFRNARVLIIFLALLVFVSIFLSTPSTISLVFLAMTLILLYSYVIYLLVHFDMKHTPVPEITEWPSITVIIPAYNSSETIEECLACARSFEYPKPFEIIVINDASKDDTGKKLAKIGGIRVITNPVNFGKARSMNEALRQVKTEFVACIDSDTYPPKDALKKMVPVFYKQGTNIAAVTTFITVSRPKNLLQKIQAIEYFNGFGFGPATLSKVNGLMVVPGPMAIYRRKVLEKLGGFDEHNITEDMEITLRLHNNHYEIDCCTEVVAPTEVPKTLKGLYRQRVRWYRGGVFNLKKYKHMVMNPKYGDFGVFSFSLMAISVLLSVIATVLVIYAILRGIWLTGTVALSWLSISEMPKFSVEGLAGGGSVITSAAIFMLIVGSIWTYFIVSGFRMAKAKLNFNYALIMVVTLLFYSMLNSFFYAVGVAKELNGSEKIW
ncbi:Glycosyltransferase AglE [Candidatus Gugararchaeum adminiculabundum]|nr:Glycosyltransferase AglE [Candidatus Gugararchaeum adminiculabundum]